LFHTEGRREAVSPVVAELWGGQAASAAERSGHRRATPAVSTHELFRDVDAARTSGSGRT
jgi:hypothetical protein